MNITNILVNISGFILIGLVYWFFLMKKESEAVEAKDEITILVEGGYKPDVIKAKKNQPLKLNFLRKDPSDCLEDVLIPEFKIRQRLKLNETTTIEITPDKVGEYQISCGMNMFHGKLIVEE